MFILSYCGYLFGDDLSIERLTSTALKAFGIPVQDYGFRFTHYTLKMENL